MVGRPLEDCLMIPSVVQLLWLMAYIFHECQTSADVHQRQNTFPKHIFHFLLAAWMKRPPAQAQSHACTGCCLFPGVRLADEETGRLRFKEENASPCIAPHWLCLSSTHNFPDAHMHALKVVATGGTGPPLSSSAEENVMSSAVE